MYIYAKIKYSLTTKYNSQIIQELLKVNSIGWVNLFYHTLGYFPSCFIHACICKFVCVCVYSMYAFFVCVVIASSKENS